MTTRARRQREKEERRYSILQAARGVFFENESYRATMDDVAERAEVSKGTVYLYCEGKETILAHLLLDGLGELLEELQAACVPEMAPGADDRMLRLGAAYLSFF